MSTSTAMKGTGSGKCPECGVGLPEAAPQGLCPRCLLAAAAGPGTQTVAVTGTEAGVGAVGGDEGERGGGGGGGLAVPPEMERVRAAFPQLEIVGMLGAGGMGVVYKARQRHLDRWVALKVLSETLASRPAFVERFEREARVLARLNHPNIVTLYDFGQSGGFCYLLMEYVDGVNLAQAMKAGRFTPEQALAVVPKVCEALQYAHELGVLHRDIKPANLLLDGRGRVKIADFGVAKLLDAGRDVALTESGAAVGTPAYMAPEQIEMPSQVDHRADIYSLGVVFYEMLTGELPLGQFAAPSERRAVDGRIDAIVMRALKKEREQRQQSADEVRTQVEGVITGNPSGPVPPPGAGVGARSGSVTGAGGGGRGWARFWVVASLVFCGLVILVVAGGLLLSGLTYFWVLKREPAGSFEKPAPVMQAVSVSGEVTTRRMPQPASGAERERLVVRLDLAEKKLAEDRRKLEAGLIAPIDLAESECEVNVVRCLLAGDEIGAAAHRMNLAAKKLEDVRVRVENGQADSQRMREAEAELNLRRIDWHEAVRRAGP